MKYYYRQNISRYEELKRLGTEAWAESVYGGTDYADFSSREFLEEVTPRLQLQTDSPSALELGCGVGPGAMFLTDRGFRVHGVELIEDAVIEGRRICAARGLDITFEVLDVTQLPPSGPAFDVIVDSYCLQSIVLDEDRAKVFGAVKGRLAPRGYYLVSTWPPMRASISQMKSRSEAPAWYIVVSAKNDSSCERQRNSSRPN